MKKLWCLVPVLIPITLLAATGVVLTQANEAELVRKSDNLQMGLPSRQGTIINRAGYALCYSEEHEQAAWVAEAEKRYPQLEGRLFTMKVPGGRDTASFRDPETAAMIRSRVVSLLGLKDSDSTPAGRAPSPS